MELGLFSFGFGGSRLPAVTRRFNHGLVPLFCFLSLALVACSPALDWRTVQSERLGYSALFPAKPKQAERKLPYAGTELNQTLDLVQLDSAIVSITTIEVPPAANLQVGALLKQLQESTLSVAGLGEAKPLMIKSSYQIAGSGRMKAEADDYLFEIKNPSGNRWMRVRWIVRPDQEGGSRVYQQTLLIPAPSKVASLKEELSAEKWDPFFEELRVQ